MATDLEHGDLGLLVAETALDGEGVADLVIGAPCRKAAQVGTSSADFELASRNPTLPWGVEVAQLRRASRLGLAS